MIRRILRRLDIHHAVITRFRRPWVCPCCGAVVVPGRNFEKSRKEKPVHVIPATRTPKGKLS